MPIDRNNAQYITGALYKPTQTSAPGVWDLDDQANNMAKNLWPLPPQAVQRSLRFNSADSTNLTRTFTATGDQTRWTWSGWVKRAALGVTQGLMWRNNPGATPHGGIRFEGTNVITVGTDRGGTNYWFFGTTAVFRDPSAWYHIVVVLNTSETVQGNRCKIYVNGVQQTTTITSGNSTPSLNDTMGGFNSNVQHNIGALDSTANSKFDGYIAEMHFVDGQVLDPTSFGETDQQTGVWIPKRYTGTYGTNGFRLSFANNSSITALGYDSSGQGNNWTPNNFSITPGSDNDSLVDVPSLYGTDTGIGGEVLANYPTLNPLTNFASPTLSNGNLTFQASGNSYQSSAASMLFPATGKWYLECTLDVRADAGRNQQFNIGDTLRSDNVNLANGYTIYALYTSFEYFYAPLGSTPTNLGIASATGDIVKFAYDADTGKLWSGVNNTWFLSGNPATGSSPMYTFSTIIPRLFQAVGYGTVGKTSINFGQRPFIYTAPSGYKALCTTNLPAPAIGQTSSNQADNHFAAVTYTGNNGTQTISTLGFQPDFVWIKNRTGANSHILVDSIRGAGKGLSSESTAIEYNIPTDFQSFNSNGFTVGYGGTNITNASANNYVAWCWNAGGVSVTNNAGTNGASVASTYRANKAAGFSIVSWTYNGAATIAHGLNAVPKFMIIRGKNAVYNWDVYHASIGPTVRLVLNSTSGSQTYSGPFNNTTPTSSVFSQGAAWYNNGDSLIGYIFAEIPGFSAFGSYTGNGSADGPFIYTGFKPALILGKRTDTSSTQGWFIFDTARNIANQVDLYLSPSSANTEGTFTLGDMLSNGFKIRNTIVDWNSSGLPYIYAAFAETPARLSTAR